VAEILIKMIDHVHPDPEVDPMCFKIGDVVAVFPDGWVWGREETLPKFLVAKFPGIDVSVFAPLLDPQSAIVPSIIDGASRKAERRIRAKNIDIPTVQAFLGGGQLTSPITVNATAGQITNFIKTKLAR
jgi:hypothetical protein